MLSHAEARPVDRMPPGDLVVAMAFVPAYVALDWVSFIHPMQQYGITPWNPQPALAIALLMSRGQRWLALVAIAAACAEVVVRGAPAGAWGTASIAAVVSLCYAAIARALVVVSPDLRTHRDVVRLVVVVSVGALITGVLYIGALLGAGVGPVEQSLVALMRFWIGDAVGVLVTLPLILMLLTAERRAELRALLSRRGILLDAALVAAALAVVSLSPPEQQLRFFYVLFLPLVWIATRSGLLGATVALLVIQAALIAAGEIGGYQAFTVFELQALLIALAVTAFFLGVTVDERRRAEAQLRQSLRLRAAGEMAAALAHELNQPLTAVTTYASAARMIADAAPADLPRLAETLRKLAAEGERAAEVVRRLRDFFRTGATRLMRVALDALASRVVLSMRDAAAAARVALEWSPPARTPPIMADEVQLEVVLRNLLANAIQAAAAADAPRWVRITISASQGMAVVTVTDSGPGVVAAEAGRIFEPFETTRATGMGMGLAISRAIAEAHGGSLRVEPGQPGTFVLQLPSDRDG